MSNRIKIKKRSNLRLFLGRQYYSFIRSLQWIFYWSRYSTKKSAEKLNYPVFSHKSPVIRKLRNVDMQLQENKRVNLKLAAERINGIIIAPGETFSFWKTVGKTTKEKGYLKGLALRNGKLTAETGGGLCQLSNLIYWMALHTPLEITERWRHSFDFFPDENRVLPFGSGATVSYNYIDLQIKNTTSLDFQMIIWLDDVYLHGQWLCSGENKHNYSVVERNHMIQANTFGGYVRSNEIYKIVKDASGNVIGNTLVVKNSVLMLYEPLLEAKK